MSEERKELDRVIPVVRKYHLKDDQQYKDEVDYWESKSNEFKLSALQSLRDDYVAMFDKQKEYDESREALRRVYRITKRE